MRVNAQFLPAEAAEGAGGSYYERLSRVFLRELRGIDHRLVRATLLRTSDARARQSR